LYFGKSTLKDPKESYGVPAAVLFYALLGPFPAMVLLVSTAQEFTTLKLGILLMAAAVTIFSGLTWRVLVRPIRARICRDAGSCLYASLCFDVFPKAFNRSKKERCGRS
jgi:hypothetical protein